ncbi:MAG: 2-dehydropantoate 2-reductase N-terminal domain-containing protein, partial [Candidatus Dormibacteria bacterium]
MRLTILGAGSWGLALAQLLQSSDREVWLWFRRAELAEAVRRTRSHPLYLPQVRLDPAIRVTASMEEALAGSDTVIFAAPSHGQRQVALAARQLLAPASLLISASKGFEPESAWTMTQLLAHVLGEEARPRLVALSGPNLAPEVAAKMPTAAVVASSEPTARLEAQERLRAP